MSSDGSSEQQGTSQVQSVDQLYQEIKMKDLAIEKATKLIELLQVELQNEKESREGTLRDLRESYQVEMTSMLQRMRSLEAQLGRVTKSSSTEQSSREKEEGVCRNLFKTFRESEPKSSVSINREYSSQSPSKAPQFDFHSLSKLEKMLYFQAMQHVEEFQTQVLEELHTTYQEESLELPFLHKYAANLDQEEEIALTQPLPQCPLPQHIHTLTSIIHAQRNIIHSFRQLIQQIEDTYATTFEQIETILATYRLPDQLELRPMEMALGRTRGRVVELWREERVDQLGVQLQNRELKGIVERMIELIQKERYCNTGLFV